MIPEIFIEKWRKHAPWQTLTMIEQDLIISRVLVDLYQQKDIAETLVFRGGTALNKIYITPPARYSEDIDLVQIKSGPIGSTIDSIRNCLTWLGEPIRNITERSVKLVYKYTASDGTLAKLKIEINTTEHFHVKPLCAVDFAVESEWFKGRTVLATYVLDELMATKLKALYQRRKGRDLFDLWLVLEKNLITPSNVLAMFDSYCQRETIKITRANFEKNMQEKCQHNDFKNDIVFLLAAPEEWHFEQALKTVMSRLVSLLPGDSLKLEV